MVFSNNLLLGAVSAAAGDYLIEQSLLFNGERQRTYPTHLRWLAIVRLGRILLGLNEVLSLLHRRYFLLTLIVITEQTFYLTEQRT
jgi:hypothetical protein